MLPNVSGHSGREERECALDKDWRVRASLLNACGFGHTYTLTGLLLVVLKVHFISHDVSHDRSHHNVFRWGEGCLELLKSLC